jgi:hypothetical protein
MRKRLAIGLAVSLLSAAMMSGVTPAAAASENSRNSVGDTETPGFLTFTSATDVFTFEVTIPKGKKGASRNGRLTVDTQDCCTHEDFWGVRILKHNGRVMAQAVGDGSGVGNFDPEPSPDDWSGSATIRSIPRKGVTVEVYYDSGSGVFGADMFVRFRFSGENIEVTQVP